MRNGFCLVLFACFFFMSYAQECDLKFKTAQYYKSKGDYKNAVIWYKKILNSNCGDYNGRVTAELRECEKTISDMTVDFVLAQSRLECEGQNGTYVMELRKTPAYWSVLKTPEWLQVTNVNTDGKKVVFNVSANPNADVRKGVIRLKSERGKIQDFTVFQKEGDARINLQTEELSFGGGGGQKTVTVKANFKWSYNASASWLRLSKQDDKLLVTCSANDLKMQRNATIIISGKNASQNITVTQYEGDTYFNISGITGNTTKFEAEGGVNNNIKVVCDEKWQVRNECPWMKVTTTDNSTIAVQCDSNPWAESRTGSFEIVTPAEDRSKTILVEQAGAEPKLEKVYLPYKGGERETIDEKVYPQYRSRPHYRAVGVNRKGGDLTVIVRSNVQNWSSRIIPNDESWISVKASQNDSLILNLSENNSSSDREANVIVSAMGLHDTLVVVQWKRGYSGIVEDYFDGGERVWKTTRFFVDVYALEPIGFRIGGLAKRWKYVEFSLLDFDVEYAHKSFYLDWEPIVRGYLPLSRNERRWALFMGMGISVNMLNLAVAPEVKFSYLGTPHFLFELGAEFQWKKKAHWKKRDEDISSRIFFRYDGFSSFGFTFDFHQWTKKWKN